MPRAFTAEESARIRQRLMDAGRDAFARRGLRGTSVDELARAAAISKGAFYRFFVSKEALLLALLDEYELAAHAQIEAAVRADPRGGIDLLVDSAIHAVQRNPLLPVLMSEEGLRVVASRPPAEQEAYLRRDERLVHRVDVILREAGLALEVPQRVLLGLLRSLVFVGQHRPEIGSDLVEAVAGWLTGVLRSGLAEASRR